MIRQGAQTTIRFLRSALTNFNKKVIESINHPRLLCSSLSNLYAKLTIKDGLGQAFQSSGGGSQALFTNGKIVCFFYLYILAFKD